MQSFSSRKQSLTRRQVLRAGFTSLGLMAVGSALKGCGSGGGGNRMISNIAELGPLSDPDENGVRLPAGFRSRVVGRSRRPVIEGSGFNWHLAPDGGAVFPTDDGGWIYTSNSEMPLMGGVSALRFAADGTIVDAYPILSGTNINCAGGPTPWGTWLSCEEYNQGQVWECDPYGIEPAVVRPALGRFQHEAVTVDTFHDQLFLTEDVPDGRFYRFRPSQLVDGRPDLTTGVLEVAQIVSPDAPESAVVWHALPNPTPTVDEVPTRLQIAASTVFRGGEGIWFHEGIVYFTTKGDNRVWAYDTEGESISILYDDDRFESPQLTGVDNVVVTPTGDVIVAEDGGNMELVALTPSGVIVPLLEVVGHPQSEMTGPAFDPSGQRLYFSSQRGVRGNPADGMTFEVTGPFFA